MPEEQSPAVGLGCGASVNVPANRLGKLIGLRGCKINSLRSSTGATIEIEKTATGAGLVSISGPDPVVQAAKTAIQRLLVEDGEDYENGGAPPVDEEEQVMTIDIPRKDVGKVIGAGGSTIQRLRSLNGVKITLFKDDLGEGHLTIMGSSKNVEAVKAAVHEILNVPDTPESKSAQSSSPLVTIVGVTPAVGVAGIGIISPKPLS